jgi:uncharacterized membrane protein
VIWLNHHRLFVRIKSTDTALMLINLLLLLIIVFIPVPTALLAEYLIRPDLHAAAIVYSGTFFVLACCFNLLWRYAFYRGRLLGKDVDPRAIAAINRQFSFGPLPYLVVLVLAWINIPSSILLSFFLALFYALPARLLRSFSKKVESKDTNGEE